MQVVVGLAAESLAAVVACHVLQAGERDGHGDRHIRATLHSRPPAEAAVGILQLGQFAHIVAHSIADRVLVEELREASHLAVLRSGLLHPRCVVQLQVLQLCVLAQW